MRPRWNSLEGLQAEEDAADCLKEPQEDVLQLPGRAAWPVASSFQLLAGAGCGRGCGIAAVQARAEAPVGAFFLLILVWFCFTHRMSMTGVPRLMAASTASAVTKDTPFFLRVLEMSSQACRWDRLRGFGCSHIYKLQGGQGRGQAASISRAERPGAPLATSAACR